MRFEVINLVTANLDILENLQVRLTSGDLCMTASDSDKDGNIVFECQPNSTTHPRVKILIHKDSFIEDVFELNEWFSYMIKRDGKGLEKFLDSQVQQYLNMARNNLQ
jgi:hypothetical protein